MFQPLGQMFATRTLARTSALLTFIWIAVPLSYYGAITFATQLQVSSEVCVGGAVAVSTEDYKDIFITATGEVRSLCARG